MKITEQMHAAIQLVEAAEDQGKRRIRAVGQTADVVNANGRRYSRDILRAAVGKLNESSQALGGRILAVGEAEHPSRRDGAPRILDSVVMWDTARFDEEAGHVLIEGEVIPTSQGKDLIAILESGVPVGVSVRGTGELKRVTEGKREFDDVVQFSIETWDLVQYSTKSDPDARIVESEEPEGAKENSEVEDVKTEVNEGKELASVRAELEKAKKDLDEAKLAQERLADMERAQAVDAAIQEATKDLPYGDLNADFVAAIVGQKPQSVETVGALVEAKRAEYDSILSKKELKNMGVDVKGPVFEEATGQPEFTRAAFEMSERLAERGLGEVRDLREASTKAERFTRRYLEGFDATYQRELLAESKRLEEAGQVSDLNLPYSVSRAIVAEALPQLVAASVFDFDIADTSPTRIYFEAYAAESGAVATVSDETYTADHDGWVNLAFSRVIPGSVTVELGGTSTVKAEYTDYVVDYANGRVMILSTGSISNGADLDITYQYNAVRTGEMGAIQRGKGTLSFQTIELVADRLAQQISDEAVTFARTQLGWDATTRTVAMIITEIREMIDQGVLRLAIAQAHVAGQSGGTWTAASDTYGALVEKLGVAKVAIQNAHYTPTAILMSLTNADKLSNWDGFTAAGNRADTQQAPGLLGTGDTGLRIKGLPVYASGHMPDTKAIVVNRELVQHRVLRSKPMSLKGPFPTYSNGYLVAADQYYVEEYNQTVSLIPQKGSYVTIA